MWNSKLRGYVGSRLSETQRARMSSRRIMSPINLVRHRPKSWSTPTALQADKAGLAMKKIGEDAGIEL